LNDNNGGLWSEAVSCLAGRFLVRRPSSYLLPGPATAASQRFLVCWMRSPVLRLLLAALPATGGP